MRNGRKYLAGLLLLCAVISCKDQSTSETASAPKVTDEWKLGVQQWTFHFFDFATGVAKADSAGIKYMEAFPGQKLGLAGVPDTTFNTGMSAEGREKVKELLRSKGITLVAFGVVVPQTPEEWAETIAFAKDMGIQYVTAEPLKEHWGYADSIAGANGIKIAIHDHPKPSPYWHPDSVLAAVKDHPNLGACADVGHWGRNGLDPVECLKKLEGHIIGLHFKDIKEMNVVESEDLVVGTGVINFPAVFSELQRQQFKGMFSIEREGNWDNNVPDVKQTAIYFSEQVSKLK
jgi:sugar phosphate isomerase/epimerase